MISGDPDVYCLGGLAGWLGSLTGWLGGMAGWLGGLAGWLGGLPIQNSHKSLQEAVDEPLQHAQMPTVMYSCGMTCHFTTF